jgi:hypothetical protein
MQRRHSLVLFCITFAPYLVLSRASTRPLADSPANFTSPLPTGVRLDPVGDFIDLGSMPIGMALAPEGDKVVVILSGWREQGIQVIDLKSMRVTQTLPQEAAFFGIAFSHDGRTVYASGGNDDSIFCYSWNGTAATFERKIVLGKQKPDKTGSRYPAGIAASRNGKLLYVAENVGDSLAVVNLETSEVVQRIPTTTRMRSNRLRMAKCMFLPGVETRFQCFARASMEPCPTNGGLPWADIHPRSSRTGQVRNCLLL